MNALRSLFSKLALIAVLSTREQLLVFFAAVAVIVIGGDQLLVARQSDKVAQLRAEALKEQQELDIAKAKFASSERQNAQDLTELTSERDSLREQVAQAEKILGRAGRSGSLSSVMRALASPGNNLQLVSIRSNPPSVFSESPATAGGESGTVYQHGVQVVLAGTYRDLVAFLSTLGASQPNLFWSNLRLQVTSHPNARVELAVQILSTSKEIKFD
jgi:MSHA biogenesis protein MshJ